MKVFLVSALLVSCQLFSQSINCGGPVVDTFTADQMFTGGAVWTPANDPAMATVTGIYQTLRYGTNFSYTLPVGTPGLVGVQVLLMEPNKTGAGQRIFTVTANGHDSSPLDLFALTGGKLLPYEVDFWMVARGQVTITFRASIGNAVCSAISMLPPPLTAKLWLRNSQAILAGLMTPFGPPAIIRQIH